MFEIKNLSKVYITKNHDGVLAIDDISLNIEDKGMVFVLGKSGSGKSTFLNLLGGLDKYDNGEIKVYGKSTKNFTKSDFDIYRNSSVGFVFQEYNILEEFTVGQNIALAILLQGRKPTDDELNDILREVDLEGYAKRRPNELSGGQLQRVAIARALVKNPEVIMADEPTGALDSNTALQVFNTLKKISKDKLVLVVSHDREFAERYADRIIEFSDGKIISDVKKYPVAKEGLDSAITIEENKVSVKKGYKLTAKDFAVINHYIEKNTDSENNKVNNDYVFKEINSQVDLVQDSDKEIKKIKSRLPLKNSFKIGVSAFRNKKIRLAITILLSVVAFSMFGIFSTFSAYKKHEVMAKTIIDNQIDYLSIKNITSNKYGTTIENIKNSDINYFDKLSPYSDFLEVYSGMSTIDYETFTIRGFDSTILSYYFTDKFQGVVEVDITKDKFLSTYGFTMIGDLPKSINEIAITKYIGEYFLVGGYGHHDGTGSKINTIDELLGEEIALEIDGQTILLKVSGIVDTKLNDTTFDKYKLHDENEHDFNPYNNTAYKIFKTDIEYGFHSLAFVKPGFVENFATKKRFTIDEEQVKLDYFDIAKEINEKSLINKNGEVIVDTFEKSVNFDNHTKIFFDEHKTKLESNEILLPYTCLESSRSSIIENTVFDYCKIIQNVPQEIRDMNMYQLYDNFDHVHFASINDTPTDSDFSNAYFLWLKFSFIYDNQYVNKDDIIRQIIDELVLNEVATQSSDDFEVYFNLQKSGAPPTTKSLKVVGYLLEEPDIIYSYAESFYSYTQNYGILISQELMQELELETYGEYSSLVGKMPQSPEDIEHISKAIYTYTKSGENYQIVNSASDDLNQVDRDIYEMTKIFFYVALGLAVFSMLLMMSYIATSIVYKKKDIGILRAMGARSVDVLGIFFNEALIMALINFALSTVGTFCGILAINFSVRNNMMLNITLFTVKIVQVLLIFVVCLVSAILSSSLPVYNFSKKQPIEAIRNTA